MPAPSPLSSLPININRTKIAIDAKLKIIDKYLPSLKSVELSGNEDAPIAVHKIELVPLSDDSTG